MSVEDQEMIVNEAPTAPEWQSVDAPLKLVELTVEDRKPQLGGQLCCSGASPEAMDEDPHDVKQVPSPAEIVEGLKSGVVTIMASSAWAARHFLSRELESRVSIMVEAGVVAPLVEALQRHDCPEMQVDAAWALNNIAAGTHDNTKAVIEGGAIPPLVELLSRGGSVGEQSASVLGNIAADGAAPRDAVLRAGALPALLPSMAPTAPAGTLSTAVWTYSHLCRHKEPLVDFAVVAPALPVISELLETSDADVLARACWAISYLSEGNERIGEVQKTPNLVARAVRLLGHKSPSVQLAAVRALGCMLAGDDEQTDRCLAEGCIGYLLPLLGGDAALAKEAAWATSNILAGTRNQIQRAIDQGMLPKLIDLLAHENEDCRIEAAFAIRNLCDGGSWEQLETALSAGLLAPYCALLQHDARPSMLVAVLRGVVRLLRMSEDFGQVEPLCDQLEQSGALFRILMLKSHENEQVCYHAMILLCTVYE